MALSFLAHLVSGKKLELAIKASVFGWKLASERRENSKILTIWT